MFASAMTREVFRFVRRSKGHPAAWVAVLVAFAGLTAAGVRAAGPANPGEVEMPREVHASIQLAQQWLAARQRADGSFSGEYGDGTAMVGSAVLAWMVSGNLPGEGPYGRSVACGVDYLLDCAQPTGLLFRGREDRHVMYHHGLATLCLAEAWGQTQEKRIYDKLKKAVDLIVRCQNPQGGWRYQPRIDPHGDLSVTVIELLALRAARDAGIAVPKEVVERAVRYVESCKSPGEDSDQFVGFGYQPGQGRKWSTTAAGLMSLMLCGQYKIEKFRPALDYLFAVRQRREDQQWFIYGNYYAAQAMYQAAGKSEALRNLWPRWYQSICQDLLARQVKSGPDRGRFEVDREYGVWGTAMTVLILGLPFRYLPIYQR